MRTQYAIQAITALGRKKHNDLSVLLEGALNKEIVPDLGDHFAAIEFNLRGPLPIFVGEIDGLLTILMRNLDKAGSLPSIRMFALSFGSLRAAVTLLQSGATPQVPVLVRHATEAALYAFLFARDRQFLEHWENREADKRSKSIFRNEGLKKAKEYLKSIDPSFASVISDSLEFLISFGAHPNIFQISGLVETIISDSEDVGYENIAMLTSNYERESSYIHIMTGYTNTLRLFEMVWPERFSVLCGRQRIAEVVLRFQSYREGLQKPQQA